jgi:proteasome accessory factor C
VSAIRGGTEESRERKIALFWTLVRAFENNSPLSQEEIVNSLLIDEYPVTGKVPKRKRAYDGNENAHRQKFERDKAAIRDLGFEITTTKTPYETDGYSIDPSSVFVPAIEITDDELNVVSWATRLLGIGATGVGRLFADGPTTAGGLEFSPFLQPLTRAVASHRVVSFQYRKDNDKIRERILAPLEFLFWRGQSYVIGVERASVTVKGFRISRITSVPVVTGEQFAVDDGVREVARSWVPKDNSQAETVTAKFVTSADYARTIASSRGDATDSTVAGSEPLSVSIEYPSLAAARQAVLSFGDHVWSLRPKPLRDEVLSWLKGVNRAAGTLRSAPTFSTAGSRPDTLGQTLQLIAAVYQSPEPLRASELAARCGLDGELVRSIMSRLMALQYLRDPTKYLVHIEPGDDLDDVEEPVDPTYARSASYDEALGSSLAPLTWRDAFELLVALKEATALYPNEVNSRVIEKIERSVAANVRVMEVEPKYLSAVRDAIDLRQQLKINYWSATSDKVSERWVEPRAMASRNGRWYFRAWCTTRDEWLTFRVDRILYIHAAGPAVVTRAVDSVESWVDQPGDEGYVVTVVVRPQQRWLFETLPTIEWATLSGEYEVVRLRVRDDRFLDQLLVEAGPGSWILDPPDHRAGRALAQRMIQQL